MKKLYSPKTIKLIQDLYGFKFTKSLGQNFLIDKNFVDKIIDLSEVDGENILEIGPGIGTISQEMAKTCKKLVVIEIDKTLTPILKDNLGDFSNVDIINADILKIDLDKVIKEHFNGESFKVVSNLPYYITTPIIEKLVENDLPCKDMTIMVQKEVADRMKADEKVKDYSSLSVFIKFYANLINGFKVPKSVFMPQPKIDSQVLKLDLRIYDEDVDRNTLFKLVRAGFNKRRKTILNSLSSVAEKEELKEVFEKLGLKENLRAENLSLDDFINISNELSNWNHLSIGYNTLEIKIFWKRIGDFMSKVTVYTSNTCPHCKAAKNYLSENNIDFEEKNVDKDRSAIDYLVEKGHRGVPVINIDGEDIVGFNKDLVAEKLGL